MKRLLMDVGSTFVKYLVSDEVGNVVLDEKVPFPKPFNEIEFIISRSEIDEVIKVIMKKAAALDCGCAFISVQMHGYILQYQTGEFSDYFSWRSGGGDTESAALKSIDFSVRGTSLKGNSPIAKLYRLKHELDGTQFYTLGSYIAYLLTGNNITHKTDACASGFYNADGSVAEENFIKGLSLPKVCDNVSVCGKHGEISVYTPVGDHAASVYGGEIGEDAYLLNIGTTSQVAFVGNEGTMIEKFEKFEKRPYFENGKRLFTIGNLFYGLYGDNERYCDEAVKLIGTLPRRTRVLVGGGGASGIFDILQKMLNERGIDCECIGCGIGLSGLSRLAKECLPKVGTMLSEIPFTNMPLIMKNAGLDFMIVDNEHGAFDYTDIAKIFTISRLANFETIVRLPDNSRAWVTKCVDAGADGFLLPMTNTAADIDKVVEYAKYAPIGKRGISTMRAHTLYNPPSLNEYMPLANSHIKVYAQIETALGVENIEKIFAVEGVDGVFIGPNDLSCDLGCIGDNAPIFLAIEKVANAAKKAGKPWGIITGVKELIEKATALGANMFSCGSELNMLANGCDKIRKMF